MPPVTRKEKEGEQPMKRGMGLARCLINCRHCLLDQITLQLND